MTDTKTEKQLKARLDICEAALEAAGYLIWDDKQGRFVAPGGSPEPEPEPEGTDT